MYGLLFHKHNLRAVIEGHERDIAPFNQSVDCPGWRNVHHFTGG
jgi:hypothetical protein